MAWECRFNILTHTCREEHLGTACKIDRVRRKSKTGITSRTKRYICLNLNENTYMSFFLKILYGNILLKCGI